MMSGPTTSRFLPSTDPATRSPHGPPPIRLHLPQRFLPASILPGPLEYFFFPDPERLVLARCSSRVLWKQGHHHRPSFFVLSAYPTPPLFPSKTPPGGSTIPPFSLVEVRSPGCRVFSPLPHIRGTVVPPGLCLSLNRLSLGPPPTPGLQDGEWIPVSGVLAPRPFPVHP